MPADSSTILVDDLVVRFDDVAVRGRRRDQGISARDPVNETPAGRHG
jgi:hypothetical protein